MVIELRMTMTCDEEIKEICIWRWVVETVHANVCLLPHKEIIPTNLGSPVIRGQICDERGISSLWRICPLQLAFSVVLLATFTPSLLHGSGVAS